MKKMKTEDVLKDFFDLELPAFKPKELFKLSREDIESLNYRKRERLFNLMLGLVKKIKEKGKLLKREVVGASSVSWGDEIQIWQYGKHIYKIVYKDNMDVVGRARVLSKVIKIK
jgi:hypothetical protein